MNQEAEPEGTRPRYLSCPVRHGNSLARALVTAVHANAMRNGAGGSPWPRRSLEHAKMEDIS
jgi:hypothetical protein